MIDVFLLPPRLEKKIASGTTATFTYARLLAGINAPRSIALIDEIVSSEENDFLSLIKEAMEHEKLVETKRDALVYYDLSICSRALTYLLSLADVAEVFLPVNYTLDKAVHLATFEGLRTIRPKSRIDIGSFPVNDLSRILHEDIERALSGEPDYSVFKEIITESFPKDLKHNEILSKRLAISVLIREKGSLERLLSEKEIRSRYIINKEELEEVKPLLEKIKKLDPSDYSIYYALGITRMLGVYESNVGRKYRYGIAALSPFNPRISFYARILATRSYRRLDNIDKLRLIEGLKDGDVAYIIDVSDVVISKKLMILSDRDIRLRIVLPADLSIEEYADQLNHLVNEIYEVYSHEPVSSRIRVEVSPVILIRGKRDVDTEQVKNTIMNALRRNLRGCAKIFGVSLREVKITDIVNVINLPKVEEYDRNVITRYFIPLLAFAASMESKIKLAEKLGLKIDRKRLIDTTISYMKGRIDLDVERKSYLSGLREVIALLSNSQK